MILRKIRSGLNSILLYNVLRSWNWLHLIDKQIRPKILRHTGAIVGKRCFIGFGCYFDNNTRDLSIGDDVLIAPNCTFLFHRRDLSNYTRDQKQNQVPHIHAKTVVGNNVSFGIGATVMPGVTIGEGAIVGARSLVTKDVPAWTIVVGVPAKKIGEVKEQ